MLDMKILAIVVAALIVNGVAADDAPLKGVEIDTWREGDFIFVHCEINYPTSTEDLSATTDLLVEACLTHLEETYTSKDAEGAWVRPPSDDEFVVANDEKTRLILDFDLEFIRSVEIRE